MKNSFKYLGVFLFFLAIFLVPRFFIEGFVGVDPYYHAEHSRLMLENNNLTYVADWVDFHFLSYAPVDLWWGYHLIQVLFLFLFESIFGLKILASIASALIFVLVYFILNKFKIKKPFLWSAFALFASATNFSRIFFERPFVLSIVMTLFIFYFLYKRKNLALFLCLIIYTLIYELAIIAFFWVFVFMLVDYFYERKIYLRSLIATLGGFVAGILVHPNMQEYINGIYLVLIKIWIIAWQVSPELNQGVEIRVHGLESFLLSNFLFLLFYILALSGFGFLLSLRKASKKTVILFIISFVWCVVAFFIPRGTEYWVPFGILFIAVVWQTFMKTKESRIIAKKIHNIELFPFKYLLIFLIIFVLLANAFVVMKTLRNISYNNINEDSNSQAVDNWLIENTEQGSRIFTSNWSLFPRLFYGNQHNKFITAYDPALFYEFDPTLFYTWANIANHQMFLTEKFTKVKKIADLSSEENVKNIKNALLARLQTPTIVIHKAQPELKKFFEENMTEYFKLSFENELYTVFTYAR